TPIPTLPITIDAPTVTTTILESNALTIKLRVAKLEKDVSELKTVDHSSEVLAVLQPYVPTVVDSYLDTKVRDVFQKELQKHTTNLIHKYSLQHLPELTKKPTPTPEQESKKIPSDILKIKKEQAERQKNPQFTVKSTDKAALEEYDLKSALYQSLHANKSFNRNLANHRLYHALIEALIEDENAMDKGVANTVKDHKRKHDDNKDDDDKDPPAKLKQGKKTKRRRTKESESLKNPSTTKETPKGKALIKALNLPWFIKMVSASKDPFIFNDLMATPVDFFKYVLNGLKIKNLTQDILLGRAFNLLKGRAFNLLKGMSSSSIELGYNFQECFNALTDKLDWNNPKRDCYPFDLSKPFTLQGPTCHRIVAADYFFNNDLEYLKTSDPE
nr:hypothetical protein [Tanacetum cinerariifolium]